MMFRRYFGLCGALIAPVVMASCAAIPTSLEGEERAELLFSSGLQIKTPPEGEGPFPTILLFHGCGGLYTEEGERKTVIDNYAQVAQDHGVAAIIVDSLSPRDINYKSSLREVCSGLRLRGRDRARDVEAALTYAREFPDIVDQENLALAGWSHGGWSVMELLIMASEARDAAAKGEPADDAEMSPSVLDGVRAVYLTYPYCGFLTRADQRPWGEGLNVRMILAGDDTLSNNERCLAALDQARSVNANVSMREFPGMTHAFDEEEHSENSTLIYDADAAATAHALFGEWLEDGAFSDEIETAEDAEDGAGDEDA